MVNIYRKAQRVVIWLGTEADESSLAIKTIEYTGFQIPDRAEAPHTETHSECRSEIVMWSRHSLFTTGVASDPKVGCSQLVQKARGPTRSHASEVVHCHCWRSPNTLDTFDIGGCIPRQFYPTPWEYWH